MFPHLLIHRRGYQKWAISCKVYSKEITAEKESREGAGAGMSQDAARHAHVRK